MVNRGAKRKRERVADRPAKVAHTGFSSPGWMGSFVAATAGVGSFCMGWLGNVIQCPVGPQQSVQDAACRVQKRLRSPNRSEALDLSQSASAAESAACPSAAAASLGDVAQAAPARGSRSGRATKIRRCCSPASQQAAADLAQLKAAPVPGTEAGSSPGVHAPGVAEAELSPTSQQAAADPAQLKAAPVPRTAANSTPGIHAAGIAEAGPSAGIAEQCAGDGAGDAGSSQEQQQQLPAEGDSEPGSPRAPAEQALCNCGALAEQPPSGGAPLACQDAKQAVLKAACAKPGRLAAQLQQQVQEPEAASVSQGKAGGSHNGCTELTQGLSAEGHEAGAAGRAEEASGTPLAAVRPHSASQAGTPSATGDVRPKRRVSFSVPAGGGEAKPRPVPVRHRVRPGSPSSPSASRPGGSRLASIGGVPAYRFGPARLQKRPAPSLMLVPARELAASLGSPAASDAGCLGGAASTDGAHGSLQSPGAVPQGGSPPASKGSPAQGAVGRLSPKWAAPGAVSGPLGPRDGNAGTRRQSGGSSLPEPKHAAAAQNMPEPLPSEGAGLLAEQASVQPSPPPSQSRTGCLPAEAGRDGTAEAQLHPLLRQQLWFRGHRRSGSGRRPCSPGGMQLPGLLPSQGRPELLPAAAGGRAARSPGQAQQSQRSPQPAPKLTPSGSGRAACSPGEAQQPQRSPQPAVKLSWATEAAQQAALAWAQHIAAEAALQSLACRIAARKSDCSPGNLQPGEAEPPVPAKLTDTSEAVVPAAREQALSAARDTSGAAQEVTSGGDMSATREQALSAARDASQAAQSLVPGGGLTAAEQQDMSAARAAFVGVKGPSSALYKAASEQGLSVARPAVARSKARARSPAASDEAPAVVEQAINRPREDGAATLASAELAGSHPSQATLPGTGNASLASGELSGSQAAQATLPGAGGDGTACLELGALPRSRTLDATPRVAEQGRRLLDLPRRLYNVKGQQAKEQVVLDPVQQDFRESYIDEKLSRRWRRGEAWAALDLQGIALSERRCNTNSVHPAFLGPLQARWQLAAARLQSEQGAEAEQAMRHLVQQEWQQLKRLRQQYVQPALQVNGQQQPFTPKSILRRASGPLKSPQAFIA